MKKLFKNMKENEKGFTLIELIVVIAIIGILAAVLLPKFSGFTDKARENAARSEAKNVYTAYAAAQSEKSPVTAADIVGNLGKLPQGITGTLAAPVGITVAAADPVISYTAEISGKKYTVEIKEGGEIKVTLVP